MSKWWILVALGIGTFMAAMDVSIVNAVLPVIQRDLGGDLDAVQWVVTVYLLMVSGLLLTFGRLGDIHGHRLVIASGLVLFVLGSAWCGFAHTIVALVVARAFQAVGAAMIFASSPAILTMNFPDEQRGQALGLQATMTYLGLALGPSLGGWLADAFGWQTVFFVNVPVGFVALAACLRFIPADGTDGRHESFDLAGAAVFMVGLAALLLALNQGHEWGWTSPLVLSLAASAVVLLAVFLRIERRIRHPMLDLSLFRSTLFSASVVSALLNHTCTATATFLMPFYLIAQLGWSPSRAGLLLTIQPLMMAAVAPLSGTLSDRLGHSRRPATVGMAILAMGVAWLAHMTATSSWHHAAVGLVLVGLGTGMFISPNNSAIMGAAPRHRQGIAAGVLASARNVGMVLGVGLAGAVVTTRMAAGENVALGQAISTSLGVAAGAAVLGFFATLPGQRQAANDNG